MKTIRMDEKDKVGDANELTTRRIVTDGREEYFKFVSPKQNRREAVKTGRNAEIR